MVENTKVAIVTGAGSGIGRAIAKALSAVGFTIAIFERDPGRGATVAADIEAGGGHATAYPVDVTQSRQISEAIADVIAKHGRVDVLVNNAGTGWLGKVEEVEEDDWDRVMAVNVKSVFLCSKAVIPHMEAAGGGRIINVASVSGLVASAGRAAYCASKGAVVMLTKAMAVDCAKRHINVNSICPGVVVTAMTEESLKDPEVLQQKLDYTPLGRLAAPEEIAPAAVYLAGPDAGFVTGASMVVDGGWSVD